MSAVSLANCNMPPFTHLELNSLNSSQHKESGTKIAGRNAVTLCAQCPFAATTTVFDIQKKTTVRMCHISHTMRRFFFLTYLTFQVLPSFGSSYPVIFSHTLLILSSLVWTDRSPSVICTCDPQGCREKDPLQRM